MKKYLFITLFAAFFAQTAYCQTPGSPIIFFLNVVEPTNNTCIPTPRPQWNRQRYSSVVTLSFPTVYSESRPIVITDNTGTIVYYSALPRRLHFSRPPLNAQRQLQLIYLGSYVFCGQINL